MHKGNSQVINLAQSHKRSRSAMDFVRWPVRLIRQALSGLRKQGALWFLPIAAKSPWLSGLYYFLISPEFRREQHAFLNGTVSYLATVEDPYAEFGMLRRNTHRLEKGLIMRPRRNVFAREYIGETVQCFVDAATKATQSDAPHDCGLLWSRDVLTEYFRVTSSDPVLDAARAIFETAPTLIASDCSSRTPYKRDFANAPQIDIDSLAKLAIHRRSVRWFLDQQVEREKIDRAIEVAAQSPSACNRQPFQFRIFDDPEQVRRIARLPMGTGGYRDNIPVLMVIVGQQRNYFAERDRHLIYIDGSLAAMSFVFAAEVQGLSTCCINWPDVAHLEAEMSRELGLAADERPIMCMAVGYPDPDAMVAYSQKKTLDQLRRYN